MKILIHQIFILYAFIFIISLYPQNLKIDSAKVFYQYINDLSLRIKKQDSNKSELKGEIEALKLHFPQKEILKEDSVITMLQNLMDKWQDKDTSVYVVKLGDCLWNIAKRDTTYGNPFDWVKIYKANKDIIKDPNIIFPSQKLKIVVNQNNIPQPIIDTTNNIDTSKSIVEEKPSIRNANDIEIQGLIVDQTQTKLGHDFYDLFYDMWQPPQNSGNFTIEIDEKPLPQLGTQVTIKINDTDVFQQILQPRYDTIEKMAEYGVQVCMSYVENYEQIQKQLSGGDMTGTGIY